MGGVISYAAGFGAHKDDDKKDSVDWLNLPCPVKYEEIQREALVSLKPELFEGLRFDFTKPLSQKFSLSHSVFMGSVEVPAQSPQTIKVSASHYEFGANLIDSRVKFERVQLLGELPCGLSKHDVVVATSVTVISAILVLRCRSVLSRINLISRGHQSYLHIATFSSQMMLIGRILTDGRMTARLKYDFTDSFTVKVNAQLTNEPHFSQGMFHFDYKGKDYQAQVQLGNNAFYGLNYIQSITPTVSLGGEAFWLGHQRKSGVGFAGRYNTDKVIATAQVATTGMVSLTYVQRVSDKVSLASDFMYNWMSKEATTSVGYDYLLRTCRLRGRFDTNGCVAAYLEERLNVGVNFLLSAEIDHWKKDYKFGFGMTVGE